MTASGTVVVTAGFKVFRVSALNSLEVSLISISDYSLSIYIRSYQKRDDWLRVEQLILFSSSSPPSGQPTYYPPTVRCLRSSVCKASGHYSANKNNCLVRDDCVNFVRRYC